MNAEDHRADARVATQLVVTLSSYLITAALAIIGAEGVVFTHFIDQRTNLIPFYIVSFFALAGLVFSIYFGAEGIASLAGAGHGGDWRTSTQAGHFNRQVIFLALGTSLVVVAVVLAALVGNPKKMELKPPDRAFAARVARTERRLVQLRKSHRALAKRLTRTERQVNNLRRALMQTRHDLLQLQALDEDP